MSAKLMIVDDFDDNRSLLKLILEDDYSLCEARTGLECLLSINVEKPDLILLDLDMPGLTGYEVCRRIRKNPATAKIPIIFMSSTDSSKGYLEGFNAGGDEHISRPINENTVMAKIRAALSANENHEQLRNEPC